MLVLTLFSGMEFQQNDLTVIGGRQEINWSGILRPIGISFASLAKIRRRDKVRRPSPPGGHDQLLIGARARIRDYGVDSFWPLATKLLSGVPEQTICRSFYERSLHLSLLTF